MKANPVLTSHRKLEGWARGLFWGWNVVFLAFIFLGFVPTQGPLLIQGVRNGVTPVSFLLFFVLLAAIPVVAVLVGGLFLRKQPYRLFALGYVVEWPLLLVLLFRFLLIRAGNPAITVLLVWLAVAEAAFVWHLLDKRIDERNLFWRILRLAGLSLLFSGTIYAAVWLAFYLPPFAASVYEMVKYLFTSFSQSAQAFVVSRWYEAPLVILQYILLFFSISLAMIMPVVSPILAGRAWLHAWRSCKQARGRPVSLAAAVVPLSIVLVCLGIGMVQPQHAAFASLENPPETPQQAQALLDREAQIRSGLVNAYLAPFRYMSSLGEVRHISDLYQYNLKLPKQVAWRFEEGYEIVIRPLLYVPVHPVDISSSDNQVLTTEPQEAAALYQRFFDTTIVEGERPAIVDAVRSTADVSGAELAWQAVDDREVHLNRQEVSISEQGDWADVQIYEVYENRTQQRQEVVYYFSLPESAVVTGLWLGNDPDRSQAFAYQIAPRGAAQAVYRNEIRYNRDPALLEQIGPRQYRLRAFPVEPKQWVDHSEQSKPGPELHLWMTYRTVALNGSWPLPNLAEKRNVYWDGKSERRINGKSSPAGETGWLPASIPASAEVVQMAHRVDFPGGQSVLVRPVEQMKAAEVLGGLRLAVVLDRSFSMRGKANEVNQTLAKLGEAVGNGPNPDLYLTASQYRGEGPTRISLASLKTDDTVGFGGQNAAELLAQFEQLQEGKSYDAVLVVTDGTGYELGAGDIPLQVPEMPIWMVHLGGGFPLGYDDPTLQAIQASGGGVASSLEEALARYAATRTAPDPYDVVDGYAWQTLPTNEVIAASETLPVSLRTSSTDSGFAALAARRLVLSEMMRNHDRLDDLAVLDHLNQLAVEGGIVTPYSSMIVLVNEAQQNQLDVLSGLADRYQREVEDIADTTRANPFAVTGVPEPEEWLLLALAAGLLVYVGWRKWGG
jgi:putative PEP-CTERM system integral membrane protein